MFSETESIICPYCGESIEIVVDPSAGTHDTIEDCSVCCRPIELEIIVVNDAVTVNAAREDD